MFLPFFFGVIYKVRVCGGRSLLACRTFRPDLCVAGVETPASLSRACSCCQDDWTRLAICFACLEHVSRMALFPTCSTAPEDLDIIRETALGGGCTLCKCCIASWTPRAAQRCCAPRCRASLRPLAAASMDSRLSQILFRYVSTFF